MNTHRGEDMGPEGPDPPFPPFVGVRALGREGVL